MNLFSQQAIIQQGPNLQESFAGLLNIPSLTLIKDVKLVYAITNDHFARLLGWKNAEQCIGQTDYNVPNEVVKCANAFISLDQKVIEKKESLLVLHILKLSSDWKQYILSKNLIKNLEGETTGICTQALDITCGNCGLGYLFLNTIDRKTYGDESESSIYILNEPHSPLPLTPKQQECVFLMMRGKAIKEIASVLGSSPRTIETHINAIKIKLKCNSRSQIIEKALNSGFLRYIPYGMIEKYLGF